MHQLLEDVTTDFLEPSSALLLLIQALLLNTVHFNPIQVMLI